ncbi:ABC transporter ATP-binding protein [Sediminitomix flava]|uniref:Putative ABC transport system ATP-binding protein n=1 Tax=Sediminitomix flava TaxID=379075 RepID=A0A315Z7X0_SEDFL|nr:ABC transporter ATP-binding protein [Sediminitomix flava]PWJ39136.1 putative ABC transport system ATP-binding protein [Sediminitomix flava]
MNIIETKALTKTFNQGKLNEVTPVKDISISIKKGECVVLKGPSGSGKTTLLTLLSCLSRPSSGGYWCMEEQVSRWTEKFLTRFRQKHIGIVFQHFNLIKGLSVEQNIYTPLLPLGLSAKELKAQASLAAEKVNISQRLQFKVDTLSGGEQQRVAIARALVGNPEILFADEPTAHLDRENSQNIMDVFTELKNQGKTIVMTTHDPLVEEHSSVDRIIEMKDGEMV